jgi:YggT family protein
MMNQALLFLLDAIVQPFAALFLLRFHLQWLRAPMRNPIGEFVMTLTNFAVLPLRRFIPAVLGYDVASLLPAFVVELIYLILYLWAQAYPFVSFPLAGLVAWTVVKLIKLSLDLLMGALLVQAVLSWTAPYTPFAGLLNTVTFRFLAPFRRVIPPIGNIDLSTLVLFILLQLILIAPMSWLESMAVRLL